MFGTNVIIGKKYFKDAPTNTLAVTSMFFTLQGEGPYAGMPAVFIRLAKCNLACSFCDTFFDDGDVLTFDEVETKVHATISEFWSKQNKPIPTWAVNGMNDYPGVVLVMTGGEPLLQNNITAFMQQQLPHFKAVQVESNGIPDTLVPEGVTLVCSPKCTEKNGIATKYLVPGKTILDRADCLKFVMSADVTSPYNSIPSWAFEWKRNNPTKEIFCSPMNIYNSFPQKIKVLRAEKGSITMAERSTVDEVIDFFEPDLLNMVEVEANHKHTAKYCMDNGCRLNLQMHLYAGLA